MSRWTKNVEITKPPTAVWETLVDYPNLPKWTAKVSSVKVEPAGPAAVGTNVTITLGRITFIQTIEEFTPASRMKAGVVNGPVTGSTTFTIKPTGNGSMVDHTLELQLKGIANLFGPFIGGGVKKERRMLKREVEGAVN